MNTPAATLEYLDDERRKTWERISATEARNTELAKKLHELQELLTKSPEQLKFALANYARKADGHMETAETAAVNAAAALQRSTHAHDELMAKIAELNGKVTIVNEAEKSLFGTRDKLVDEMKATALTMEEVRNWKTDFDDLITQVDAASADASEATELLKKVKVVQTQLLSYSKSADEYHEAIESAHDEIFGATVEVDGEESESPGLKAKLEDAYKDLKKDLDAAKGSLNDLLTGTKTRSETVEREWQARHQAINSELTALLPNALTAGLSAAYGKKRVDEQTVETEAARSFFLCVIAMSLIALIPIGASIAHAFGAGDAKESIVEYALKLAPLTLPLYLPALWFAHVASKRRSLAKRLVEEYAHKETLSKTYQALAEQVAAMKNEKIGEELRTRLLFNLLEVNSENPGKLISDYGKADHPLLDALDKSVKLATAVERLGKLPGFGALATRFQAQADKIQKEQSAKAEQGFSSLEDEDGSLGTPARA